MLAIMGMSLCVPNFLPFRKLHKVLSMLTKCTGKVFELEDLLASALGIDLNF